ncbi:MAG: FG-GAP and VCBS repeat-containing protein [Verrucomicrobiota bacterium]|nr:FG-GAP and VCBS repeat-containing protein [Verrucomicrobiota bacterium]
MKTFSALYILLLCCAPLVLSADLPKFRHVTIDDKVKIGYGIAIADMNADNKKDIVLCDARNIAWYENPSWKKHIIVENLTQRDHVCIAVRDINGDGKAEIAAGAQWNPGETSDTSKSGAVFYLIPPDDRTQKWTPVQLHHEPTTHRMRWFKNSNNKFELIVLPLHGRGNRSNQGEGVRTLAYHMPINPKEAWKTTLVDGNMHASHNFDITQWDNDKTDDILLSGVEGVFLIQQNKPNGWQRKQISNNPTGEVRLGRGSGGANFVTAIEPMHGSQLSVYTLNNQKNSEPNNKKWQRNIIDDTLDQGHALATGDFMSMGADQIVAGWRGTRRTGKVGIKLYYPTNKERTKWESSIVDDNQMATEDIRVADINDDGKLDIIAAGRASHNLKIYFNE